MNKLTFLIAVLFNCVLSSAQELKVEPPNWWAGMESSKLQLMVYGENIAEADVKIEREGVQIESLSRFENPDYLFIDLDLGKEVKPGKFDISFRLGKKQLSYEYVLAEREKGSALREGYSNSDVIYLLMPDRFANGNSSNDIFSTYLEKTIDRDDPYGRHGGDIAGIIDHLDYFEEMGFTALWLNPVLENNQSEESYHGYAITDFYKVDSRMGTNEEYRELCRKAGQKGIKIIMDMVFNHCGSEHWWMKDLPSDDWINNSAHYVITNHIRTVNQDPYASEEDKELMSKGWFVPTMPDLNQENPFLENYLVQNSIWWIEYLGLGGIRMDTYPYPDKEMMARWCNRILSEYPNFNMVGEEWTTNPLTVSYWQKGQINRDGYEPGLPGLMDFPLQDAVSRALNEEEGWDTGLKRIYGALSNDFIYPDPRNLVIFPDNHDMARFYMQLDTNIALYKLGIAFYLTTRGIPQIFYGSEILMTHHEGNDHGNIRKDFLGGWKGDRINAFTGENLSPESAMMKEFFRNLLNWRKECMAVQTGDLTHFVPQNGVYVYFRYNTEDTVMVILNKNEQNTSLETGRFKEFLNGHESGVDIISKEKIMIDKVMSLDPLRPYIIELD